MQDPLCTGNVSVDNSNLVGETRSKSQHKLHTARNPARSRTFHLSTEVVRTGGQASWGAGAFPGQGFMGAAH